MSTWHYTKDGAQTGPASTEEIHAQLAAGTLPPTTMVWRSGMAAWAPASTLPEFAGVAGPPPVVTPAPPSTPAPAKGGNRTLIIVLCVLGGFLLLIGGCVTTCTFIAAKKAKEYSQSAQKNPAYASLSLIASLHPDVQVVSKDEATGKITLRNKKTGEVTTFNTKEYTADAIAQSLEKFAQGARAAAIAQAPSAESPPSTPSPGESESVDDSAASKSALAKLPTYLPAYAGATDSIGTYTEPMGSMKAATYSGFTHDKPAVVLDFYEKKLVAAGFSIMGRNSEPNNSGSTDILAAMAAGPARNVTITATAQDDGRVHVEFAFSQLAK